MPTLSVTLFGVPRIERDGAAVTVKRRKSLALLAYLAVTRQPHGRDALATLLWPDAAAERARAGLRRTLVDLNAALGKGWLDADGDQVALRAEWVCRSMWNGFMLPSHRSPSTAIHLTDLCDACLAHLAEAADLYTADFLAGFTLEDAAGFDDWQTFQSESLRLELAGVLEKLAQGLAGRQQWEAAISHARRWLALDPLNEPAHRLLMQLHAWAGDRAAAVRQYQECVRVMQEELGIEPETETAALVEAIRCTAAGLPSAPPLPGSPAPVHNLLSDPTPFVGREPELAQVAERLADPACRLLTVIGPGGMGKTRLAIQAARRQTDVFAHGVWFVDLAPVSAADFLAAAIVRALPISASRRQRTGPQLTAFLRDKHLLLVLDNFEHLSVEGSAPCYGLLPNLLAGAPRVKLLVTSRVRLNLREEWLAPLEGLETPEDLVRTKARRSRTAVRTKNTKREAACPRLRRVNSRRFATSRSNLPRSSTTAPPLSSWPASAVCGPTSSPTMRMPARSFASAGCWTARPSLSSWPRPGFARCRWRRSPASWSAASACWRRRCATCRSASAA